MKQVLEFLRELRANNNREWFTANKMRYVTVNKIVDSFAEQLIAGIGSFDPSVRGLTVRDVTYRIYRDARFSHDKTPYKTHFGVYVCPGGKKSGNPGYYFHIEPQGVMESKGGAGSNSKGGAGGSEIVDNESIDTAGMIGGHLLDAGIYMPEPAVLKSVRDEILDNGEELLATIKKAERAGFKLDMSNSLRRTPKGFPTETEWDDYLKLKDLHLSKFVGDDYILAPDLAKRAAADFIATKDFMHLMRRAADYAHEEL